MNDVGIILQARIGSTRLPGKVLKPIGRKPLLQHIFYRVSFLRHSIPLIVATSTSVSDNEIVAFCEDNSVSCFRGSETDVLERYFLCAKENRLQHIIRLTGDNPFVDAEELDRLIDLHLAANADYSSSLDFLPVGVGAEIFSFQALEKSYLKGTEPWHREHVNEYILENPGLFHIEILDVPVEKQRSDVRLTVDTKEDYKCACRIVANSQMEYVSTGTAIELFLKHCVQA